MRRFSWYEFKARTNGLPRKVDSVPFNGARVVAEARDGRDQDWALWVGNDGRRCIAPLTTKNKLKASTSLLAKLALDILE